MLRVQKTEEKLAAANGIHLAYDTFGDPSHPPIVLVMGLGMQMLDGTTFFVSILPMSAPRRWLFTVMRIRCSPWHMERQQQKPCLMQDCKLYREWGTHFRRKYGRKLLQALSGILTKSNHNITAGGLIKTYPSLTFDV